MKKRELAHVALPSRGITIRGEERARPSSHRPFMVEEEGVSGYPSPLSSQREQPQQQQTMLAGMGWTGVRPLIQCLRWGKHVDPGRTAGGQSCRLESTSHHPAGRPNRLVVWHLDSLVRHRETSAPRACHMAVPPFPRHRPARQPAPILYAGASGQGRPRTEANSRVWPDFATRRYLSQPSR
jgi:hypothetical protein